METLSTKVMDAATRETGRQMDLVQAIAHFGFGIEADDEELYKELRRLNRDADFFTSSEREWFMLGMIAGKRLQLKDLLELYEEVFEENEARAQ